jgi:protein-S-isoprenylcysteine O-methyltransferase Ste14
MLFVLIGWWFHLSNIVAMPGILVYFVYKNRFQIQPEEKTMKENFDQV